VTQKLALHLHRFQAFTKNASGPDRLSAAVLLFSGEQHLLCCSGIIPTSLKQVKLFSSFRR